MLLKGEGDMSLGSLEETFSFIDGSFDGVWSIELGSHILNKQRYADEMLRIIRPGGVMAVADWNRKKVKFRFVLVTFSSSCIL